MCVRAPQEANKILASPCSKITIPRATSTSTAFAMTPHPLDMSPERYSGEADAVDNHTILPLHCVVQVTGNNRTKLSLLGQRGVIIQAGDLGGWHTLVRACPPSNIACGDTCLIIDCRCTGTGERRASSSPAQRVDSPRVSGQRHTGAGHGAPACPLCRITNPHARRIGALHHLRDFVRQPQVLRR